MAIFQAVMLVFRGCNRGKISYLLTSYLLKKTEEFLLAHPTEDPVLGRIGGKIDAFFVF